MLFFACQQQIRKNFFVPINIDLSVAQIRIGTASTIPRTLLRHGVFRPSLRTETIIVADNNVHTPDPSQKRLFLLESSRAFQRVRMPQRAGLSPTKKTKEREALDVLSPTGAWQGPKHPVGRPSAAGAPGHGRHFSFQPAFSSAALSLVKIMRPALVCKTVVTTTVTVSPT